VVQPASLVATAAAGAVAGVEHMSCQGALAYSLAAGFFLAGVGTFTSVVAGTGCGSLGNSRQGRLKEDWSGPRLLVCVPSRQLLCLSSAEHAMPAGMHPSFCCCELTYVTLVEL
jgi:hypothetical protein